MHGFKPALVALIATTTLVAAIASAASANRLSVSEDEFDMTWRALRFTNPSNPSQNQTCPFTLLGAFHSRTITKTAGGLIGFVDHAAFGSCTGGTMTLLTADLPWHLTYQSFRGSLPEITEVRLLLVGAKFAWTITGQPSCLFTTDTTDAALGHVTVDPTTGQATTMDAAGLINPDNFLCQLGGVRGEFSGTGNVEDRNGGLLFVRLIEAPDVAEVQATPASVGVTDLEQNDTVTIRNVDDDATATEIEPAVVAADRESPEFAVRSPTCTERLGPGESCTYTVVVNSRPEPTGRVRVEYDNGSTTTSTTVEVDIES